MSRLGLWVGVLSVLLGLVLFPFGIPTEWFGSSFFWAGLVVLWREWGRDSSLPRGWKAFWSWFHQPLGNGFLVRFDLLSFFLIFWVVYEMIPGVAGGKPPIEHDHMVHLVKALQLKDHFLLEGRLWGWSHNWFAGYPAHYLYPFGADLWVVFTYALGFGKLSINQAYAYGFFLHWVFMGVALYLCGRRPFSPMISLLATLLFLIDLGSFRMGGWDFLFRWGVWPISLSVAFSLLSLTQLRPLLLGKGWRHVGWFGLWMGFSLWSHPIQVIHFAALFPLALLAYAWSNDLRGWTIPLSRLSIAFGIGICIGGLWLFPFLSTRNYTPAYGLPWYSISKFARELFSLHLFKGTWEVVTFLGLIGLLRMLLSRRFYLVYFGFFSFVMLVLSPRTLVDLFHLLSFVPALKNIQTVRFIMLLKPFLFLGCAWLLVEGGQFLFLKLSELFRPTEKVAHPSSPGFSRTWGLYLRIFLCVFVLASITGPLVHEGLERHFKFFWRDMKTTDNDRFAEAKQEFVAWARPVFRKTKGFFRLGLWTHRNNHLLMDLSPRLSVPIYKIGSTPAAIYRYKMETHDPDVLRYVNVRYILTDSKRRYSYLRFRRRFKNLYLYEFKHWSPEPYTVVGSGAIKLEKWSDEDIVLRVASGARGQLRLHVSAFPRWSATRNGKPIPIRLFSFPNLRKTAFMTVALKPGTYRFQFRRSVVEYLSFFAMILGLLLFFFTLWLDSSYRWAESIRTAIRLLQKKMQPIEYRLWKPAQVALSLGLMGLVLVGLVLGAVKPDHTLEPQQKQMLENVSLNLVNRLDEARVSILKGRAMKRCRRNRGRWFCWRGRKPAVLTRKPFSQPYLDAWDDRKCLWFRYALKRTIMLRYRNVKVGDVLLGDFTLNGRPQTSHHLPVQIVLFVNDRAVFVGRTTQDAKTHRFAVPIPKRYRGQSVTVRIDVRALRTQRKDLCLRVFSGPLRKGQPMPKNPFLREKQPLPASRKK